MTLSRIIKKEIKEPQKNLTKTQMFDIRYNNKINNRINTLSNSIDNKLSEISEKLNRYEKIINNLKKEDK